MSNEAQFHAVTGHWCLTLTAEHTSEGTLLDSYVRLCQTTQYRVDEDILQELSSHGL